MPQDLNVKFRYNKIKPVKYGIKIVQKLRSNPISKSDDWNNNTFKGIKRLLRFSHYKTQKRRCAYCRRLLNPEGINEHIDHIVARNINHRWMFKPKNLILACYQCNTQKSKLNILINTWVRKRLPKKANNFIYFNPYYHHWHEHFEIEDNLFIKANTVEAQNTIKDFSLYDYKYSIVYADEANIFGESAIKRANKRLRKFSKGSDEYKSAEKLIKQIERHI